MKKSIALLLFIFLGLSCSTNNDSNGNLTTTVVPVDPTDLTGNVVSPTQINLSWTDNSTNETGFKIERKIGTGNYVLVGTVNTNIITFSNTGLTPSTTYTYRIYSYNTAGNSDYSNEISLTTQNLPVSDIDGNVYPTVIIGTQTWTQTNLNVSHYRNGDVIPQVTDPTQWANLSTGAWCYYNNNATNGAVYGKLYNWYAVNDPRGLAPVGYHIPSFDELTTIQLYLTNSNGNTGGRMKEVGTTHWESPNTGATNDSGFSGLPGGWRLDNGTFSYLNQRGCWISTYSYNTNSYQGFHLRYDSVLYGSYGGPKTIGASIRCLKD